MTNLMLSAALVASATLAAGSASAATYTYDFTGSASQVGTPDIFSVSAGYATLLTSGASTVTENAAGLGVATPELGEGSGSAGAGTIDGSPLATTEYLTVAFDAAVNLDSFTLGLFDGNDDFSLLIQTLTGPIVAIGLDSAFNAVAIEDVVSFTIFGIGVPILDGIRGNDEFTLAGFTVSGVPVAAVPLPAGAGLLLGGLGLLALARRRRAA